MKTKKDNFHQFLKKDNKDILFAFLTIQEVFQLSLTAKKYYLTLKPIIDQMIFERSKNVFSSNNNNTGQNVSMKKRKNKKKQQSSSQSQNQNQTEISVQKFNVQVAKKKILSNIKQWIQIQKAPFNNSYLKKKFEIGTNIIFQNQETKQILCLNRSIIDPRLNYNKGGFDADKDLFNNQEDYSHLYDNQIGDYDFTSPQSMMKRQRQILAKIQEKKNLRQKQQQLRFQDQLLKIFSLKKIAVILCFGGSFSFGIFQGQKCLIHKSDKKYVCRKKAGQRQLNRDKQTGSCIKSMGSQIRRDQQKKHIYNVNQILTSNKKDIQQCDLVFLQAPGLNRLFIINDSQTLSGAKDKLRSLCLTAKKANFTEVQSLYESITEFTLIKQKGQNKKQEQSENIKKAK